MGKRTGETTMKSLTLKYDSPDAKGTVVMSRGTWGPNFDVIASNGIRWPGTIDLYKLNGEDTAFVLAVALPSGETHHTKFYNDGRVETFTE
jgi:hypothetical protein